MTFTSNAAHLGLVCRASPARFTAALVVVTAQALASVAVLLTTRAALAAALRRDGVATVRWVLALGLLFAAVALLPSVLNAVSASLSARYVASFQTLLAEVALAPAHIDFLEDERVAGRLATLADESRGWAAQQGVPSLLRILQVRLTGVGVFLVIARWNLIVAVVLGCAMWAAGRAWLHYGDVVGRSLYASASTPLARAEWFRGLLTAGAAAKEVRLFRLTAWALGEGQRLWSAAMRDTWRERRRAVAPVLLVDACVLATLGGAYAFVVHDAWAGQLGVPAALVLLQACDAMSAWGPVGNDGEMRLTRQRTQLGELLSLRAELAQRPTRAVSDVAVAPPTGGIVVAHVSFTYPGAADPVFRDLNLTIPRGQTIAIVGSNGAGKSTLIKLLTGLYRPDSGSISVNGRDPASHDPDVAVVFQDFTRFELPLRDNVAIGLEATDRDDPRIETAIEEAQAGGIVEQVGGSDRLLAPGHTDGTDLSGGQWQRIALARAFARRAPILILDEPTSALDVRAEAELFDTALGHHSGTTTIVVSHRLSTVRRADRIVVIDDGVVAEDGTHDELLALGGHYARAFRLQANRFLSERVDHA